MYNEFIISNKSSSKFWSCSVSQQEAALYPKPTMWSCMPHKVQRTCPRKLSKNRSGPAAEVKEMCSSDKRCWNRGKKQRLRAWAGNFRGQELLDWQGGSRVILPAGRGTVLHWNVPVWKTRFSWTWMILNRVIHSCLSVYDGISKFANFLKPIFLINHSLTFKLFSRT